ncbi:50S ribosomal protein L19e [Candidatus Micrarchaeota archaeon]|nr:50S ribosomal protein L19e [Candidatus Micrarchaeota archaeon]
MIMSMTTVRRLAADILNVGRNRIRISPDGLKDAEGALTRADVKGLIDKGVVTKAKTQGRASTSKKKRRGQGSRKGSASSSKERWMQKVRAQRKFLQMLIDKGALEKGAKKSLYGKIKSGLFRSKKALLQYLKENKYLPEDFELEKKPEKKPAPKKKRPRKKPSRKKTGKKAGKKGESK